MRTDRFHGRPRALARLAGFSIIELLVGVSILGVLLAIALPSFSEWIRNNQVRVAAETLREGLQLARSEAVKRNTRVRLQLVSTLDASCALATAGPYWIVNMGATTTPAGACNSPISTTVSPYVIQSSPVTSSATKVALAASRTTVAFDASGRMAATTNPTTSLTADGVFSVTVTAPAGAGTCVVSSGNVRCLKVLVTTAGEVRMCDTAQTSTTDPTAC